jgi:hypothetical protein
VDVRVRAHEVPPAEPELARALETVGLGGVSLDRDAARLSVGQAARVALLRVVLARPSVLLLDEPDASLDDASAAEVARVTGDFVAGGGAAVRVSHVRADASAAVRYRMADGLSRDAGSGCIGPLEARRCPMPEARGRLHSIGTAERCSPPVFVFSRASSLSSWDCGSRRTSRSPRSGLRAAAAPCLVLNGSCEQTWRSWRPSCS